MTDTVQVPSTAEVVRPIVVATGHDELASRQMRPFRRRRITEHTDLAALSSKRLLREHRRQVLAAADPRAGGLRGESFWISSSIEDELDRRGVPYPTSKEILGGGDEGERA